MDPVTYSEILFIVMSLTKDNSSGKGKDFFFSITHIDHSMVFPKCKYVNVKEHTVEHTPTGGDFLFCLISVSERI